VQNTYTEMTQFRRKTVLSFW